MCLPFLKVPGGFCHYFRSALLPPFSRSLLLLMLLWKLTTIHSSAFLDPLFYANVFKSPTSTALHRLSRLSSSTEDSWVQLYQPRWRQNWEPKFSLLWKKPTLFLFARCTLSHIFSVWITYQPLPSPQTPAPSSYRIYIYSTRFQLFLSPFLKHQIINVCVACFFFSRLVVSHQQRWGWNLATRLTFS